MDKQAMLKQLQQNRQQPFKKKEHWTMVNVGQPVQISKSEGNFYENLVVVRSDQGKYAVVQYKGKLPRLFNLMENSSDNITKTVLVGKKEADIVEDAIEAWIDYKHYHLNAYNFIMTYCLVKGVDLVKMSIIDL